MPFQHLIFIHHFELCIVFLDKTSASSKEKWMSIRMNALLLESVIATVSLVTNIPIKRAEKITIIIIQHFPSQNNLTTPFFRKKWDVVLQT